jgi:hypothetical protein
MQARKWVVGNEYDEVIFARLERALSDLHYSIWDQWSGLAVSQDIQQWTAVSASGQLTIESETYVGLSVKGPPSLIADLKTRYEQTV